jgi:LysR family transcriptional regulator for metE and metH
MKRIAERRGLGLGAGAPSTWSRPQLEVRDLELALALAAAGTTAGAAASLHITQSAISRALAQAEDRLGVRLFDRSVRGLTPTAAGARLVAAARPALAQLCELERLVVRPAAAPVRIRLVCECYTAYRWLPSALAQLRTIMPDLKVEIAADHTRDPMDALVRHKIDVALLTTAVVPAGGDLVQRPLFSDEVVFVVAASHPLARARTITREDLRAHPLITSSTPPAEARWFMTSVFGRQRPRLHFVRFPLTEAIMDAARAGMGVAVLSEWMASGYLGGGDLVVKRLAAGPLRRPWRIAYHRAIAESAVRLMAALGGSAPRLGSAAVAASLVPAIEPVRA